ncbi:MAG: glycosyltransferase, partial [Planctomycetota bacterium]
MPRILLVHPFAQAISGPDRSILAVIRELGPQGYAYDVVLPGESPFAPDYRALGCRVFTYPMSILKRRLDPAYLLGYALRFVPTILYLRRVIRQTLPDLVHVNGGVLLGAGPAAVLTGVPAVTHIRCTAIDRPAPVAWTIALVIAATSRRVIGISQACADIVGKRIRRAQTRVVFNGIDLAPFADAADRDVWRTELDLPAGTPILGQVGRIGPDKGWLDFVRVAARVRTAVPEAHFVCVGAPHQPSEHKYLEEVRAEGRRLGIEDAVHFVGQRDDIATVMGGFDVFVTMAHEEGLGRVAIEAMAAGVPVVANGVHGL